MSLKDINCNEELPETTSTLEGNVYRKHTYVFENYGYNCFTDDTGLEIEVLNGGGGLFNRYVERCVEDNMSLVLQKLDGVTQRTTVFRTVIALIVDGKETLFEGCCGGDITENIWSRRLGYDPIFVPSGFEKTFRNETK